VGVGNWGYGSRERGGEKCESEVEWGGELFLVGERGTKTISEIQKAAFRRLVEGWKLKGKKESRVSGQ